MATRVPPITKPNMVAIAGMEGRDILSVREYYIARLLDSRRRQDADTIEVCLDWIVALTSEMRLRGGSPARAQPAAKPVAT